MLRDRDRHGNERFYVRVPGRKMVRIRAPYGSEEFWRLYSAALESPDTQRRSGVEAGSLEGLCRRYFNSVAYKKLAPATQSWRRRLLNYLCDRSMENGARYGDCPFERIGPEHIEHFMVAKLSTPHEADKLLKSLRALFGWALKARIVRDNPAKGVDFIKARTEGHHIWTLADVEQFEARHAVGTKARLALSLLLYTGQRRSDVVLLGPQHETAGWLSGRQVKTGKAFDLPILAPLREALDAASIGHLAYIVTEYGRPFSAPGFGNKFRTWCDEANLPHCSAHGLRKSGASRAAENGATASEIMAVFRFSLAEAETYVRGADRRKLAASGAQKIIGIKKVDP